MEDWSIGKSAAITDLGMCINHYRLHTVGLFTCIRARVKIRDQFLTPDMIVVINAGKHKQCSPNFDENYFDGPPNFILDVYDQSEITSIKERKATYASSGVQEYLVVREDFLRIEWNRLQNGKYKALKPDKDGITRSKALPGLWIPIPALQKRDFWAVMASIDQGITRREHHELMDTIWNK